VALHAIDVPLERVTRLRTLAEVFADCRSGGGTFRASPAREVWGGGEALTPAPVVHASTLSSGVAMESTNYRLIMITTADERPATDHERGEEMAVGYIS